MQAVHVYTKYSELSSLDKILETIAVYRNCWQPICPQHREEAHHNHHCQTQMPCPKREKGRPKEHEKMSIKFTNPTWELVDDWPLQKTETNWSKTGKKIFAAKTGNRVTKAWKWTNRLRHARITNKTKTKREYKIWPTFQPIFYLISPDALE